LNASFPQSNGTVWTWRVNCLGIRGSSIASAICCRSG
jgi:hypothetical protein